MPSTYYVFARFAVPMYPAVGATTLDWNTGRVPLRRFTPWTFLAVGLSAIVLFWLLEVPPAVEMPGGGVFVCEGSPVDEAQRDEVQWLDSAEGEVRLVENPCQLPARRQLVASVAALLIGGGISVATLRRVPQI